MAIPTYSSYMPPIGGTKQSHPELTDHCRPGGETTYPEHDYPTVGEAQCCRCGATEKRGRVPGCGGADQDVQVGATATAALRQKATLNPGE